MQASLEEKEAEVQKLKVRPSPCLMVKQPCPIPASLQIYINLRNRTWNSCDWHVFPIPQAAVREKDTAAQDAKVGISECSH